MSYYLYTNGVLKLVDREEPKREHFNYIHQYKKRLKEFAIRLLELPSIAVSDDLKKIWKEGQRYEEGKDFTLEHWTGSAWWPNIHLVDGKAKPGTQQRAVNTLQEEKEDQGEIAELIRPYIYEVKRLREENRVLKEEVNRLKNFAGEY